jgi:diaminopimelate decarboxylase
VSNPLAPKWLRSPAEANVLSPALWAAGTTRTAAGELSVQGIPASTLVADYGSPLYVVDLDDVRRRAVWIRDAMADAFDAPGRHTRVYYATKALLAGDVLQVRRCRPSPNRVPGQQQI